MDSDTDDYDESIDTRDDDDEPAIAIEESSDNEQAQPAGHRATASKSSFMEALLKIRRILLQGNDKTVARKNLKLAKSIMESKKAEKKSLNELLSLFPPIRERDCLQSPRVSNVSNPQRQMRQEPLHPCAQAAGSVTTMFRSGSLLNLGRPTGSITYVDSHFSITNPENPDRMRTCDRCGDPDVVECQKCHCSPIVWRCSECFQYHASRDAKIRRLSARMQESAEGDEYESDSSE